MWYKWRKRTSTWLHMSTLRESTASSSGVFVAFITNTTAGDSPLGRSLLTVITVPFDTVPAPSESTTRAVTVYCTTLVLLVMVRRLFLSGMNRGGNATLTAAAALGKQVTGHNPSNSQPWQ